MNEAPRAVVFDLDGTLVDSMPLVLRAYAYALAPYRPEMGDAEILALLGGPPERFFTDVLGEAQAAAALARLEAFGAANWQLIESFAGMAETIAELGRHAAVGLWTGRDRVSTEWLLRTHGIAGLVRAGVCGDDLPSHKPDPAGLREVLRQLGVAPAEAVFAGDADVDILAGTAAGVRTILIEHGRAVPEEIRAQAWRRFDRPAQAYAFLRDMYPKNVYKK